MEQTQGKEFQKQLAAPQGCAEGAKDAVQLVHGNELTSWKKGIRKLRVKIALKHVPRATSAKLWPKTVTPRSDRI